MATYVRMFEDLVKFTGTGPNDQIILNVGNNVVEQRRNKCTFGYELSWVDFCLMMDSIIKNAKKVAVVIRPRLAAVITFNFIEMTIETPAAWEIIKEDYFDNAFEQTQVEYKKSSLIISFKKIENPENVHTPYSDPYYPYSEDPYSEDTNLDDLYMNTPVAPKPEPEKKDTPAQKLNAKSADKIKSIMQQTMSAVQASKDVPVEINHQPYIEPSTPTAAVTPEEQSRKQDEVMADLAKKLEEATKKVSVEIDNDSWDDDEEENK